LIDDQTEAWGIKVTSVEVRDVELPESMQRAMARQAEAEREKRAKLIHASGEFAAAERLSEAARIISSEEGGLQLRYLQTLTQIANDRQATIFFPLPIDITRGLIPEVDGDGGTGGDDAPTRSRPRPASPEAPAPTERLTPTERPTPRPTPAPDFGRPA